MKKRTDDDGLTEEEWKEVKAIQKETAKIKALASKTKDDTVDTTDRMVTLNEHTKEVGAGTMRNLQDQGGQAASFFFLVACLLFVACCLLFVHSCCLFILVVWFSPFILLFASHSEQLRRIENNERRVQENLEEANHQAHRFKSIFSFGREKKREQARLAQIQLEREQEEEERLARAQKPQFQPQVTPGRRWQLMNSHTTVPLSSRPYSATEDQKDQEEEEEDARDAKINRNLDMVHDQVTELLEQSKVMGDALDSQAEDLDNVSRLAEKNRTKATQTTRRIQNL